MRKVAGQKGSHATQTVPILRWPCAQPAQRAPRRSSAQLAVVFDAASPPGHAAAPAAHDQNVAVGSPSRALRARPSSKADDQ